jgi:endonuclease III
MLNQTVYLAITPPKKALEKGCVALAVLERLTTATPLMEQYVLLPKGRTSGTQFLRRQVMKKMMAQIACWHTSHYFIETMAHPPLSGELLYTAWAKILRVFIQTMRWKTNKERLKFPTTIHPVNKPVNKSVNKVVPVSKVFFKKSPQNRIIAVSTKTRAYLAKTVDPRFTVEIAGVVYQFEERKKTGITKKKLLEKKRRGGFWSKENLKRREETNGHSVFQKTAAKAQNDLEPKSWSSKCYDAFVEEKELGIEKVAGRLLQFSMLKDLVVGLEKKKHTSVRRDWAKAIPAKCELFTDDGGPYTGCGCCVGCRKRFAQVTILIKCASGVADRVCVTHWGAVFHSQQYRDYTLEDWANMEEETFALLAASCSKQYENTLYLLPMFRWIVQDGKLPLTVQEFIRFYGFGHKSAALILTTVLGHNVGIPCDRHLLRIFHQLGWVSCDIVNETKVALCVESWLAVVYWAEVNDVLAGLAQLLEKGRKMKKVEGKMVRGENTIIWGEVREMEATGNYQGLRRLVNAVLQSLPDEVVVNE